MPTEEDFQMALAIAREQYRSKDPQIQAERSGALWVADHQGPAGVFRAELPFLGTAYAIHGPDGEVRYLDNEGKQPALWEKILILHYFTTSDGSPLSGKWIGIREIPDSRLYLPNFEKRAVAPLLGRFRKNHEEVLDPALRLGGERIEGGDVSVTVPVFPRVPVTLQFWRGDEEFPARLNILFDKTIVRYLPTEDIILASQMLAFRLIGLAGK